MRFSVKNSVARVVVPGGRELVDEILGLVTFLDDPEGPVAVEREALGDRSGADRLAVDDHQRPGRVGPDRVSSLDAPGQPDRPSPTTATIAIVRSMAPHPCSPPVRVPGPDRSPNPSRRRNSSEARRRRPGSKRRNSRTDGGVRSGAGRKPTGRRVNPAPGRLLKDQSTTSSNRPAARTPAAGGWPRCPGRASRRTSVGHLVPLAGDFERRAEEGQQRLDHPRRPGRSSGPGGRSAPLRGRTGRPATSPRGAVRGGPVARRVEVGGAWQATARARQRPATITASSTVWQTSATRNSSVSTCDDGRTSQ